MASRVAKTHLYTFRLIRDCLTFHVSNKFNDFFPNLGYCVTPWYKAAATTIKPLRMIYNRAVRHCCLLKKLNMKNFENFVKFSNLKPVFK